MSRQRGKGICLHSSDLNTARMRIILLTDASSAACLLHDKFSSGDSSCMAAARRDSEHTCGTLCQDCCKSTTARPGVAESLSVLLLQFADASVKAAQLSHMPVGPRKACPTRHWGQRGLSCSSHLKDEARSLCPERDQCPHFFLGTRNTPSVSAVLRELVSKTI